MTTEQTQFFFDCFENSTELYREAPSTDEFFLKSFFDEPTSNDMFIEVEPTSDVEDSLFTIQEETFEFPTRLQDQFIRLVSSSSERSQRNVSRKQETRTRKTKRIKRVQKRKTRRAEKKKMAKSEITKNACCNIVQKTISLIKKGEFSKKLQEICFLFSVDVEEFKMFIVNEKTRFTGTKALEKFLAEKNANRYVFAEFFGWFLREKYIRYAIKSGEMSNLQAYIAFKNEVILPLL